jgi:hypothetical protein
MRRTRLRILAYVLAFVGAALTLGSGTLTFGNPIPEQYTIETEAIEIARQADRRASDVWARRPPGVMPYLVRLAALTVAKLTDPVAWIAAVAVMLLSGNRRITRWWVIWIVPLAALIATGITLAGLWSWWVKLGFAGDWLPRTTWIFASFVITTAIAYSTARLFACLFRARHASVHR